MSNIIKLVEDLSNIPTHSEDNSIGDERIVITLKRERNHFQYKFELVQDPNCCGLYSVGDFRIERDSNLISQKAKTTFIKKAFKKLLDNVKQKGSEFTLFFTLINNEPCNLLDSAIKDGELFTLVKTFKNLNSGKVNKLYISN